jgi:hypothetical protein
MGGSTFHWAQTYGAGAGTVVPTLSGGVPNSTAFNNLDFMDYDGFTWTGQAGYVAYTAYPIRVPAAGSNFSYEKWLRAYWLFAAGITNSISNVHIYRANTNGMNDQALKVYAKLQTAYLANTIPPTQRSSGAGTVPFLQYTGGAWVGPTQAYPANSTLGSATSAPNNTKVTLNGGNTSITASGWSDYMVFQLEVPSSVATPGNIGTLGWRLQYDES